MFAGEQRRSMTEILKSISTGEFKFWALGLFFVGFGLYELAREEISIWVWRKTQGTIIDSQTTYRDTKEAGGPQLTVVVRYRYKVDGREYESSRLTTGEPIRLYFLQQAAEFRKRFPPGGAVTVLYAPYDPSQATLIAERSYGPWMLLGAGALTLFFAVYLRKCHRAE